MSPGLILRQVEGGRSGDPRRVGAQLPSGGGKPAHQRSARHQPRRRVPVHRQQRPGHRGQQGGQGPVRM